MVNTIFLSTFLFFFFTIAYGKLMGKGRERCFPFPSPKGGYTILPREERATFWASSLPPGPLPLPFPLPREERATFWASSLPTALWRFRSSYSTFRRGGGGRGRGRGRGRSRGRGGEEGGGKLDRNGREKLEREKKLKTIYIIPYVISPCLLWY